MKNIAVIGGGITGVTTAYALVKRGFSVTLFEKNRYAAMETSFANGGQLSASNAEVWNNPKPSWHKMAWFAEFVANIPNYRSNTIETTRLAIAAREHLFAWAEQEGIDFDLKTKGILHIYRDKASFDQAGQVSRLLAAGGLQRRAVTPQEMRAIEPTLAGQYHGGYFTESDATGDIHRFTRGLADAAVRKGVKCLYEQDVSAVTTNGQQARVIVGQGADKTTMAFDAVVVCAGTASRDLAASLGDRVNIYPVKGYSITVNLEDAQSQASAPEVSLLDDATKLVSSRLGQDRFRVAGTAEFNGYNRDIRADRIKPLVDWVQQCFPGVSTHSVVPWAGLRPMMPNMLPRVGRGKSPCVFYNTGHGHLGWTLSAVTAEMVAGVVEEASKVGRPAFVAPETCNA
jgi:D-amino-acid dehydrogenase